LLGLNFQIPAEALETPNDSCGDRYGARAGRELIPLYLSVIERTVSEFNLTDIDEVTNNIDKITKQRDDIVSQLYRTMKFLATVMILVFLLEIKAVAFKGEIWGLNLKADQGELVFGLLLMGNLIALLFATAMMKMFMIEFILRSYLYLREEATNLFVFGLTYRFYAFTFGLIADQSTRGVPKGITVPSRFIHAATIILLPLTYILAYVGVLFIALRGFWKDAFALPPINGYPLHYQDIIVAFQSLWENVPTVPVILGRQPQFWYFVLLCLFNLLTLSVYAFVFFPCRRPTLPRTSITQLTANKAYQLWDAAGQPTGRDRETWLIAERQVKMLYNFR
jgi:hypothetical protein